MGMIGWLMMGLGIALASPAHAEGVALRVEQQVRWAGDTVVASDPGGVWVWSARTGALIQRLPPTELLVVSRDGSWIATDRLLFRVGIEAPLLAWPEATAVGFDEDLTRVTVQHASGPVVRRLPVLSGSAASW
jgi:hypothetical protein